jgi:hypothetical protein
VQAVEGGVGDEGDAGAVESGGEPVGDAGQPGDDLGEVVDAAAAAQLLVLCTVASKRRTCSPLA